MSEDSIAGSIYMRFYTEFLKSLFHKYYPGEDDVDKRLLISDNYSFSQTLQMILVEAAEEGSDAHFNVICEGAFPEYHGSEACAYNVARSLSDAIKMLKRQVSPKVEDWKWHNLLSRHYTNLPFSQTPLRALFHREVPVGGNANSPNVSGIKMNKNYQGPTWESKHTTGFRMIVGFDKDDSSKDVNLYSIDTGMNG